VQQGSKPGTVDLPPRGGNFRIVDPETLETLPLGEDGQILFGGTQVMPGYLKNPQKTAEVIIELEHKRWYKTGDKGHLDEDGFPTIVDRYSRFAKIGGEMISLGAIEGSVVKRLPEDAEVLVLATVLPGGKKGEKVVLPYAGDNERNGLGALIDQSGRNPLTRPYRSSAAVNTASARPGGLRWRLWPDEGNRHPYLAVEPVQ